MTEPIKRMDIKEFREAGYLQEANRLFFHPLGLALEVVVEEDGSEHLGGIWDYRDDPDGMQYGHALDLEKANRIKEEFLKKAVVRLDTLGFIYQPAIGE